MPEKSLSMEMGNLVCRFGDEKVLLDLADEIVLPCFFGKRLVRSYDKTSYFFHDVSQVMLHDGKHEKVIGIIGRYIKDTTFEREQIFEQEKGLVKDSESMRSSPSAIFLLVLNNHRLIYVKETKNAPPKESFRATLLYFIKNKHKEYINNEYNRLKRAHQENQEEPQITKKDLYERCPIPTMDLIPLTSEDSIEQFVKKYSILKVIEISLSDRNDENDNDPFFEALQKRKDAIGSNNSIVKHSNSKGLDKNNAISEIAEATMQGNQNVKLSGVDGDGDTLRGNNQEFELKKPLHKLSLTPKNAASELYNSFLGLVEDGIIKIPETSEKAKTIINAIAKRWFE